MHWVESITQWPSVVTRHCCIADAYSRAHRRWLWRHWCRILHSLGCRSTWRTGRHTARLYGRWGALCCSSRSIRTACWICRNRPGALLNWWTWRIHWSNTRQGTLSESWNTSWWWCLAWNEWSWTCNARYRKIGGWRLQIHKTKLVHQQGQSR